MEEAEDIENFEKLWLRLSQEICQTIYTHQEAQELKNALNAKGYLSLEEKSQFIILCDCIKYEVIASKYGAEGTEGYKVFSQKWQNWFQHKGVKSLNERKQKSSVDHIMFGSTPDPESFLLHFEHEILGSMKPE